jgi:hypothetical protein
MVPTPQFGHFQTGTEPFETAISAGFGAVGLFSRLEVLGTRRLWYPTGIAHSQAGSDARNWRTLSVWPDSKAIEVAE